MVKIKIPRKIRVGAYEYDVLAIKDLIYDHKLLGQALTDKETIKFDPSARYRVKCVTFWHEVIHAICDTYRLELKEEEIDRIAHGLVAVMIFDMGIEFEWAGVKELSL